VWLEPWRGLQPLPWLVSFDIVKYKNQEVQMKKLGRPKVDTEGVLVRLPRDLIERLDDLRREQKDIPTRPEMIRRILLEKLETGENPRAE
jgi:hypothetical protein